MATAERATKNLSIELQRFREFTDNVILPILIDGTLSTTKFPKPKTITTVEVSDLYGHSLSQVFSVMFKRLTKYGEDKNTHKTGAMWIVNPKALNHFAHWNENTIERTGRSLLKYLLEAGVEEIVWSPTLRGWVSKKVMKLVSEDLAKHKEPDNVDYSKLLTALKTSQ